MSNSETYNKRRLTEKVKNFSKRGSFRNFLLFKKQD